MSPPKLRAQQRTPKLFLLFPSASLSKLCIPTDFEGNRAIELSSDIAFYIELN